MGYCYVTIFKSYIKTVQSFSNLPAGTNEEPNIKIKCTSRAKFLITPSDVRVTLCDDVQSHHILGGFYLP